MPDGRKRGYCSWCGNSSIHLRLEKRLLSREAWACESCKKNTVSCRIPQCTHMAKDPGGFIGDLFCAEHAGEIYGFRNNSLRFRDLDQTLPFFRRPSRPYGRYVKTGLWVGGGAVAAGASLCIAAPALGGAIGSQVFGLTGAAATSKGLAFLGGGSLATGGCGMAGGVAVVTTCGSLLGSGMGGLTAQNYALQVGDLRIDRISTGRAPAVVAVDGFLTDGKDTSQYWGPVLSKLYPGRAAFYIHWDRKNLLALGKVLSSTLGKEGFKKTLENAVKRASKTGMYRLAPIGRLFDVFGLINNPWFVAYVKSPMTGQVIARILRQLSGRKEYIVVGHSLGARLLASTLGALSDLKPVRIHEAHLLGGATAGAPKEEWERAASAVRGSIHNYHSNADWVLQYLYKFGTFFCGSDPIGRSAIMDVQGIENHDLSAMDVGHLDYKKRLGEILVTS